MSGPGSSAPRKRAARTGGEPSIARPKRNPAADDLGDALTAGFRRAVEAAIQQALDCGLAVPGREGGEPVERRPDGTIVRIDDPAH
jgi:hypothetical protein